MKQNTRNLNAQGYVVSLQPSNLINVGAGNTVFPQVGLLKNIGAYAVSVTVVMAAGMEISTTLYPGWNVEKVRGVKGITTETLQFGY